MGDMRRAAGQVADLPQSYRERRARSLHGARWRAVLPDPSSSRSDDLEVALELPVRHRVLPLTPLPLAGGGEMVDEVVDEPVPGTPGLAEDARGLDQGARGARDVLGA